jgi:hypothetical protein
MSIEIRPVVHHNGSTERLDNVVNPNSHDIWSVHSNKMEFVTFSETIRLVALLKNLMRSGIMNVMFSYIRKDRVWLPMNVQSAEWR